MNDLPGGRLRGQPVVGWRLWRLHDGRLRSWVVQQEWEPGTNEARCLTDGHVVSLVSSERGRCAHSPGADCKCGLWAIWDFGACARKAREESAPWDRRDIVIGLVAGWGTVAIHGEEGFRCQYGAVRCLFTDAVAGRSPAHASRPGWWTRLVRRIEGREPGDVRAASLRSAADRYGVPLLAVADAVRLGVLGELGVPAPQLRDVAAQLTAQP